MYSTANQALKGFITESQNMSKLREITDADHARVEYGDGFLNLTIIRQGNKAYQGLIRVNINPRGEWSVAISMSRKNADWRGSVRDPLKNIEEVMNTWGRIPPFPTEEKIVSKTLLSGIEKSWNDLIRVLYFKS